MSDSIGVFDVAMTGDDERRIAKIALDDKLAAATYDVREKHGEWLFNASNLQAFNDRVAMCYGSIGRTVSEHVTARTGTIKRVVKNLEQEWRQRQAAEIAPVVTMTPGSPVNQPKVTMSGPDYPQGPTQVHPEVVAGRRQACYPGCESNEAHAKKFHKDKAEKDAGRRQAAEDGAYERSQPDHPEQHIQETFQDHQGEELIPDGDFHGYQDSVDQGGPGKVESHDFIPGEHTDRHDESDSDNFVPTVTGSRGIPFQAGMPMALPKINQPMTEYQRLARLLVADDLTGMDPNAGPSPDAMSAAGGGAAPPTPAAAGPTTMTPPAGSPSAAAAPPGGPPPITASREFQVMARMLQAEGLGQSAQGPASPSQPDLAGELNSTISATPTGGAANIGGMMGAQGGPGAPAASGSGLHPVTESIPGGGAPGSTIAPGLGLAASRKAHGWAVKAIQEGGTLSARQRLLSAAAKAGALSQVEYDAFAPIFANRHKLADRNYLQQADEAITKVLNEKAEEFQNTIAPLQQALITIQQAEQLQNPLNVQPPAGTVNVLPQGAQGNPAPAGDPSGGQAPQGAGGLGADPAAAALAGADPSQQAAPPQQLAASRRQAGLRVWHHNHGGNKPTGTTMKSWADDQGTHHHVLWDDGTDSAHHSHELHTYGQHADQPPSATTASRGRLPFDVRRQTAGIETEFDTFQKKKPGLSSGPAVDVENFVQQKQQGGSAKGNTAKPGAPATGRPRFGPKAINKLKTKQGLPAAMQIGPTSLADTASGITARRRTANDSLVEPGYAWSKAPASVKSEFAARVGSGVNPEQVFRAMIGEITKHHEGGLIGSHDAHRAANEAFGRLLLSRRGRRPLAPGGR